MKKIKIFLFSFLFILVGVTAFTHNAYATASFSVSNCSISMTSSWCNVTINWSATGLDGTSVVTANFPELNTKVGSGDSGTATHAIPSYGATFYFKNHGTPVPSTQEITITPAHSNHQRFIIENCVIRAGNDTCLPHVQWLVENPYVEPMITATIDGKENTLITKGASGSVDDFNHTIQYSQNRTYYLYHDNVILDSKTITAVCAGDTEWNGTMCSPAKLTMYNNGLTPGACIIRTGESTCMVKWNFSWLAKAPKIPVINPVIVDPQLSVTTPNSQTLYHDPFVDYDHVIPDSSGYYTMSGPESRYFFVYYGWEKVAEARAVSFCQSGSVWYGAKCFPATFSATDCVIAPNQSTCLSTFDFNLYVTPSLESVVPADNNGWCYHYTDDVTSIKTSNGTVNGTVVYSSPPDWPYCDTNPSGGVTNGLGYDQQKVIDGLAAFGYYKSSDKSRKPYEIVIFKKTLSQSINYGENYLSLYNNFSDQVSTASGTYPYYPFHEAPGPRLMATATPTATCTYGYTWDDTAKKCLVPAGTFVVTPCTIKLNEGSCNATLDWNVRNPKDSNSTDIIITTISSPTNTTSSTNMASFGTKPFALFHDNGDSDFNTTVVLKHDEEQLASYGLGNNGYASCEVGLMWDNNVYNRRCVSTDLLIRGTITADPCTMSDGESTCHSKLSWKAWELKSDGTTQIPPASMPTIEVYYNGIFTRGAINTNTTTGGGDNKAIFTDGGQYFQYLFDTVSLGGTNYSGTSTGQYPLPGRDINYYEYFYRPYGDTYPYYTDSQTRYRNVTFKLVGHYDKVVISQSSFDQETQLCLNITGNPLNGSGVPSPSNKYHCYYDPVLAEATVNATCGRYGYVWDDNANACIPTRTIDITLTKDTLINDTITKESVGTTTGQVTKTDPITNIRGLTNGLKTAKSFTPNTKITIIATLGTGFNLAKTTCNLKEENDKGVSTPIFTGSTPNLAGEIIIDVTPSSTSTYSMVCNDTP